MTKNKTLKVERSQENKRSRYLVLKVRKYLNKSGGDNEEVTPVPIPNTAVKLFNADDSWLATARENM